VETKRPIAQGTESKKREERNQRVPQTKPPPQKKKKNHPPKKKHTPPFRTQRGSGQKETRGGCPVQTVKKSTGKKKCRGEKLKRRWGAQIVRTGAGEGQRGKKLVPSSCQDEGNKGRTLGVGRHAEKGSREKRCQLEKRKQTMILRICIVKRRDESKIQEMRASAERKWDQIVAQSRTREEKSQARITFSSALKKGGEKEKNGRNQFLRKWGEKRSSLAAP